MARTKRSFPRLLAGMVNEREQERIRVARVLHDDVGQLLSATGLYLDALRMDMESQAPEFARRVDECQQLLEQAVSRVRQLSSEFKTDIVERAGLQFALERLIDRYQNRFSGTLRLLFDPSARLPAEAAAGLSKVAELALDNAVKHANCTRIDVIVRPDRDGILLEVKDDGAGFHPAEVRDNPPGLGLLLMQCHAGRASLRLNIRSAPRRGTIVRAKYVQAGMAS